MKRRIIRSFFIGLLLLVCLGGGVWYLGSHIHASYGYCVEAAFSEFPADDSSLEDWLKAQPGVSAHTVHIERRGKGETITIIFIQSRNLFGNPPFPSLDAACQTLGYKTPVFPFRDVPESRRSDPFGLPKTPTTTTATAPSGES